MRGLTRSGITHSKFHLDSPLNEIGIFTVKLRAVVVLSIFYATTLFSSFAAAGDDAWYFARFGKEKCIAIADVDVEKSQRLYGELGDMEYPGDVGAAFPKARLHRHTNRVEAEPHSNQGDSFRKKANQHTSDKRRGVLSLSDARCWIWSTLRVKMI